MPKQKRKKFVRGRVQSGRLRIQPLDLALLNDLAEFRFLNTDQIAALHHRGLRNLQRRLSDLYHEGYIDRPRYQYVSHLHTAHMVYGLGVKAAELLFTDKEEREEKLKQIENNRTTTFPYIAHALMISQFHTALRLAAEKSNGKMELTRWYQGRELYKILKLRGEQTELVPDAMATLKHEGGGYWFFLEADRSSMPNDKVLEKFKIYWQWKREKRYAERLGITRFRVLTITISDKRKENLRLAAKEADDRKQGSNMFLFLSEKEYSLKNPEALFSPVWLSPKDDNRHSLFE
jgi:hypothetical protein